MKQGDSIWLVVNSASGSNDDNAVAGVTHAFADAGITVASVVSIPDDDLPGAATLDAAGIAAAAIFTGDGTVNAFVRGIEGWDGEVLVLPGGTANLLAKELHGDRPAEEIIADAGAGRARPIRRQCVRCEEGAALVELLAGPGATWSDVREAMRDGDVREVAENTVEAVRQSSAGPMVAITDPPLGKPDGYAGVRMTPDDAGIVVEGYGADGLGDYLKQGLALLKRDFREGPHDDLGTVPRLTCRSEAGEPIALMIDGERSEGRAVIGFEIAQLEVVLLATLHG